MLSQDLSHPLAGAVRIGIGGDDQQGHLGAVGCDSLHDVGRLIGFGAVGVHVIVAIDVSLGEADRVPGEADPGEGAQSRSEGADEVV